MITALFNDANYAASKKMLDATVLRHDAIASNLANVETPNYKRVDVDPSFVADLRSATAAGDVQKLSSLQPTEVLDRNAIAANRDGNTVQLEKEMLAMNQNTLSHQFETQMITGHLLQLRLAITGH
ncbi:MAG TPA: flagellar basal body rod protein FlgB [Candidatus Limnocylindria bacterium]|nr:flagellar basal body rod protein FlgB [Candidatus Limnocylindria bacterium]